MADITDIKTILYTEKSLGMQERSIMVVQTTNRMNKNKLKQIFKDYFGISPLKVNSLKQSGKVKKFKGRQGQRVDFKKFYVKVPEGANIDSLSV